MSSKDILDIFINSKQELDLETIMYIVFTEYKLKRKNNTVYNIYDYVPQNLIKIYYSRDINHSDFKTIVDSFKKKYLKNESIIEGAHTKEEVEGLGEVYDYIRSDEWQKCPNIYIILLLNLKIFSKTPYPEAGGNFRNANSYLLNSKVNLCPYNQISTELTSLYQEFDSLLKQGISLGENAVLENEDKLIEYIDNCIKLKCKLIWIHPFSDGNGRTMRALVNLLFKLAGLPPIYVLASEKDKYLEAMSKAVEYEDYSYINKFYYYKICDSILELDVKKRIKKEINQSNKIKQKKLTPKISSNNIDN